MNYIVVILIAVISVLSIYLLPTVKLLLIRGTRATSKTLCTGIFLSKRDPEMIKKYEMFGYLDKLFTFIIDKKNKQVVSSFISPNFSKFFGLNPAIASFKGEQFGCQLLHSSVEYDKRLSESTILTSYDYDAEYTLRKFTPQTTYSECIQDVLKWEFSEAAIEFNHTRGIAVMYKGDIVGEGYQDKTGILPDTRLLGWSMTKSVISALIGVAVGQGILSLDSPVRFPEKMSEEDQMHLKDLNNGEDIVIKDLLQMNDILRVYEDYGFTKDVVEMIYTVDNSAEFAVFRQDKTINSPDEMIYVGRNSDAVGKETLLNQRAKQASFEWYYSSAVSNLLAHQLRVALESDSEYHAFPHKYLFSRIGASSFAIETDPEGGFVGSSFAYATARDWALLGELFLRNGEWHGEQIVPQSYVKFVQEPHPLSGGHYGGHFWLNPARVSVTEYNLLTEHSPDAKEKYNRAWMTTSVPADAYFMSGFQGQYVMITPSLDLVVARLGLTNKREHWDAGRFFSSIVNCISE